MMKSCGIRNWPRLLLALFLALPVLCFAQADVDVGGGEGDDYGGSYPADQGYGQGDYGSGVTDGLPIVYAGDGMRVSIEKVDESGVYASGTITLNNQAPMPFNLQMQLGDYGEMSVGEVQTPSGPKPLRAWNQDEEVTLADFEGRRFRLVYQEDAGPGAYSNSPPPPPPPVAGGNETRNKSVRQPNNTNPVPPSPVKVGAATIALVPHKLGGTHTLLAPKGWKVEGGAWSPPQEAFSWIPSRMITVTGPDGTSVRFNPVFAAFYKRVMAEQSAQPGSINRDTGLMNMPMPRSTAEWGQWIEQGSIRGPYSDANNIRIVKVGDVPQLTQQLRQLYAPLTQAMQAFNSADSSIRTDQLAMSIESTYSTKAGRWQQIDAFNYLSYIGEVASAWGGADSYEGWDIRDSLTLRAPEGTLDAQMPVLLAVVNSLRETPEYARQILQLQTRISQGNHQTAMQTIETYAAISRASYRANNEINAGIMNSYNERNASQDRGQRDFVNYIHDQQDYADPSVNGNVTLPGEYDRVFSNGLGEYVLTNDVSFEPGADWSALQKTR